MPNWVYNSLAIEAIEADPQQVKDLMTQLNQPFSVTHDSWNIETSQMEKNPTTYREPLFAFWNIIRPLDLDTYFGPQPKSEPDKPITFDSDHWYDWNVRNWGTKWDVANQDKESLYNDTSMESTDNSVIYSFNTAWSVPYPAILKLSEQYPELVFNLFYQEETGWGGNAEFMNGKMIREMTYDSQCLECDGTDCMEYCEDGDCGEICNACHWLGQADLESVAKCEEHKVYLDEQHLPEYRSLDKV